MALTEQQLSKVRSWAKRAYDLLLTLPEDTTPLHQKLNRTKFLLVSEEVVNIRSISELTSPAIQGKANNLLTMVYDYVHYFDTGYRATYNIDGLREKLIVAFARVISLVEV